MGLAAFEEHASHTRHGTCACGFPIEVAWHSELNGWWETEEYVCEACTARKGEQVTYTLLRSAWPADKQLPPFELGKTTTSP